MENMETEEFVTPVGILAQVETSGSNRLYFRWGTGNEIFCCDVYGDGVEHKGGDDADENMENNCSRTQCIRWGDMGPTQRRVIYDTSAKFLELATMMEQKKHRRHGHEVGDVDAMNFAEQVSAILGATSMESDDTGGVYGVLEEKALWELVCAFTFDAAVVHQAPSAIPDVASWYHGNATALCGGALQTPLPPARMEHFQYEAIPEMHEHYWMMFLRAVAVGWISEALDLLGLHSAWMQWDGEQHGEEKTESSAQLIALEGLSLLLRRFPTMKDRGAEGSSMTREFDTIGELMTFRKSWIAQCKSMVEDTGVWEACKAESKETADACLMCLQILIGDEDTIQDVTTSWAEYFIASLVHRFPDLMTLSELRQLLSECLETKPPTDVFHECLASVINAHCEMDHQAVLRSCSMIASDWFLGHVCTILEAHPGGPGPLKRELVHAGGNQIEFYRLEYACSLAPYRATWEIAAKYMVFCQKHGKSAFVSLLSRIPLSPDGHIAAKAISLAEAYALHDLKRYIQLRQAACCWQEGLYSLSAYWYSLAQDAVGMDSALGALLFRVNSPSESQAETTVQVSDLEQCLRSLHVSKNIKSCKYASLALELCIRRGNQQDFELALDVLRNMKENDVHTCMPLLLQSVDNIKPEVTPRDDLMMILEWINVFGLRQRQAQPPVHPMLANATETLLQHIAASISPVRRAINEE